MTYADLGNHLWQSSLFALAMWALTLALRGNRASIRYALWLAASLKFLLPFSLLVGLGAQFEWRTPQPVIGPAATAAAERISQPFERVRVTVHLPTRTARRTASLAPFVIWSTGAALVAGWWALRWWRIRRAAVTARPVNIDAPLPIRESDELMEPGVFGLFRPVLLLPRGIRERLTPEQLQAVLSHELCHVERRDNLAAALHMLVETLFWFHPLVWWIGRKMVDERERACDEEVLRRGNQPEVYAESILNVCKFYLESPLACTAGITGSDLKKRIESIMTQGFAANLTLARKALLAATAVAAVALPFLGGMLRAQTANSDKRFEVVSIKPSAEDMDRVMFNLQPGGGIRITGMAVRELIGIAFDVRDFQISGGPAWISTERYDITAKVPAGQERESGMLNEEERRRLRDDINERVRNLLVERFQLLTHWEKKDASVYALAQLPAGHKMKPVDVSGPGVRQHMRVGRGNIEGEGAAMEMLIQSLSRQLGRPVLDRTGLTGGFHLKLEWTPDPSESTGKGGAPGRAPGPPPPGAPGSAPSLFTALQEQLGLKLESTKGAVDQLFIDKIEKPSAN